MASQQAWDDFESVKRIIAVLNSQIAGSFKGYLDELNSLFTAISADPARSAEVIALADSHPVLNSAYLSEGAGKFLALRAWLIANGYILE
jgi:hypothetical protein